MNRIPEILDPKCPCCDKPMIWQGSRPTGDEGLTVFECKPCGEVSTRATVNGPHS